MARLTGEAARRWLAENPNASYIDNRTGQKVQAQQNPLLKILLNITKPIRTVVPAGQELVRTIGDLGRTARGEELSQAPETYFGMTPEESAEFTKDPLQRGVKAGVGLMSYGVPVGAAKGVTGLKAIGQAAGKGAISGGLGGFAYSNEGKEIADILKGGAFGGVLGGALQGIGEVSKGIKAAKISNKLDDMADDLQASALKKDIGIAPTTKQGKNILPKDVLETANKMGVKIKNPEELKAFGQALYESNANVANVAAQQLDDLGRAIDITDIKKPLLEQLAKTKSPELRAPIQKVIDSIDSATGGSNVIPASELLNLKREWGKLGNWNPLMDPAATTTAGAFEAAYMKANDLLDDAFKSAGITGFKEANKALSLAIDADNWADRAIANRANRPLWNDMTQDAAIAATVFGGGGPAAAAGAVGSKVMQRYAEPLAEGALRGASKVARGASALPQVLQPILNVGQRAVPAVAGLAAGTQGVGTQGVGTQPIYPTTQGVQQRMEAQGISPLNLMLAQEVLNGNISAAEANAVLSLLGMDAKSTQSNLPKTDTGRKAMVARDAAIGAYQLLQESPDVAGKTAGIENLLYGLTGAANQSTAYKSQIEALRSQMFNALGGSSLTPTEKEQYEKFLPKVTDSAARARQKIEQLVPMLEALMGASISSTETLEQY
jgi:hypothetical protein